MYHCFASSLATGIESCDMYPLINLVWKINVFQRFLVLFIGTSEPKKMGKRYRWTPEEDKAIELYFKEEIGDVSESGNKGKLQSKPTSYQMFLGHMSHSDDLMLLVGIHHHPLWVNIFLKTLPNLIHVASVVKISIRENALFL